MSEVLLINPRKRGGKKRRAKTSSRRRTRRSNPIRRARSVSRRRRNPVAYARKRVMRRRRSNPIRVGNVFSQLMPAVKGAAGAIATDVAFRMIPLPGALSALKGGMLAPVTKIAVALGVGYLASRFGGRTLGREMTSGALVVIAYDVINQQLLSRLPVVSDPGVDQYISGLGYQSAGQVLTDNSGGMDQYISGMGSGVLSDMEGF